MKMSFHESLHRHNEVFAQLTLLEESVSFAAELCCKALFNGGKILVCGNGGSAADAQHIAAEFVGRFLRERRSLPAVALTTDTSALTAIANDYGYENVFSRQVQGLGQKGDVLIAISTSGNSPNVISAVQSAKELEIKTVGFLGKDGGELGQLVDIPLVVPSSETARIQEAHIFLGHYLCEVVDNAA